MLAQRADFPQARVTTQFLRVPRVDWARVLTGEKTELRAAGRHALHHKRLLELPMPVAAYSFQTYRAQAESALLVIERAWSEPLAAISDESLAAEGFSSLREFRNYWKQRHQSVGWRPLSIVQVVALRPWDRDADPERFGRILLERLYGTFL